MAGLRIRWSRKDRDDKMTLDDLEGFVAGARMINMPGNAEVKGIVTIMGSFKELTVESE